MSANIFFYFLSKKQDPLRPASKKNKKGLASVILATNSPNSELVILILIEKCQFVNKKTKKNQLFFEKIFYWKKQVNML